MVQHEPCSIGRAMEVLGERWTFLIVREAFFGVRRFTELQRNLGIARNILSARLQTLTRAGILERIRYQQEPERFEYKLTEMRPRPLPGGRLDPPLGRRVPRRRRGPAAAALPPGVRPPRLADDGLQPLRRAARPAQGDPRAGARRARRYRFAPMSAQDTTTELWGGETRKAVDNFPVSGERVPVHVVRWLGRIKGAAARANAELGLLDERPRQADRRGRRRDRRGQARRPVPDRRLPDRLGHLVEHERQRGDRQPRRRGRPPQRPREHGAVVQRRLPERRPPRRARPGDQRAAAGARAARGLAAARRPRRSRTSSSPAART